MFSYTSTTSHQHNFTSWYKQCNNNDPTTWQHRLNNATSLTQYAICMWYHFIASYVIIGHVRLYCPSSWCQSRPSWCHTFRPSLRMHMYLTLQMRHRQQQMQHWQHNETTTITPSSYNIIVNIIITTHHHHIHHHTTSSLTSSSSQHFIITCIIIV